nr:RNA-directed DNA polymerase, eukaryota, reverse transcriptase zinc-binding domain protein [Tanacetum cinerariifolium]
MASSSNRRGAAHTTLPWTTAEKITLCTAWCNAMDTYVTRDKQFSKGFWEEVYANFKKDMEGTIRGYDAINGSSDLVLFQNALAEFQTGYEQPFTMKACWRILKDHPAWSEVEVPTYQRQEEAKAEKERPIYDKELEEFLKAEKAHELFRMKFGVKIYDFSSLNLARLQGRNQWRTLPKGFLNRVLSRTFLIIFPLVICGWSAKDMRLVDVYIPNRKSKAGKRYAFERFIRVDNLDHLVNNLCTVWNGRLHMHANVVRFDRPAKPTKTPARTETPAVTTYASVSKGIKPNHAVVASIPSMVLDDSHIVHRDLSLHVMGDVKQFMSIQKLPTILSKEGFPNVKLTYLGGLWVMMEFSSLITKEKFLHHVGVASWFNTLSNPQPDFVSKERIVWVDIEGVPLHLWSLATFSKIGSKWGEMLELEESKDDLFARKRLCIKTKQEDNILEKFKILIRWKAYTIQAKELFTWVLIFQEDIRSEFFSDDESVHADERKEKHPESNNHVLDEDIDDDVVSDTYCFTPENKVNKKLEDKVSSPSDGFKSRVIADSQHIEDQISNLDGQHPHMHDNKTGGSILEVMDGLIKLGQTMGYFMDGCLKDMGDYIVMGDFNEVRLAEERLGSNFNVSGANDFNAFIANSGLIDLHLEGYSFTWSHPSAQKMGKHLSDHRPILLREIFIDFGATPFRLFHSWFSWEGFDKLVTDSWNDMQLVDRNDMVRFKKKLQDGEWIVDPMRVKEAFKNHFASRFQHPSSGRCHINFSFPNRFSKEQQIDLESHVSTDEIRKAVWDCGENKSPGPDGYTFEFYRKFWSLVGPDFCKAIQWFFEHSVFPRGCNSSFVALILKVPDAKFIMDFGMFKFGYGFGHCKGEPYFRVPCPMWTETRDPLAPYLFILVMESLHLSFSRVIDAGEWSDSNLDCILQVLQCFYFDSGLKINVQKNNLMGVGINPHVIAEAASKLGCSILNPPFKYLGLLLWKSKTLLIGGRLTLLKAVLGASLIYVMSLYKVPKTIMKMMERIRSKFFNGVDGGDKKIIWIKSSKVLVVKKNGGLGVSSFYALNRALIFKWVWRFISQEDSLWFRTICAIHGNDINRFQAGNVSPWVSILREVHSLNARGIDLVSHCKKRVGDGLNTSFWHDNWIDGLPLKQKFPCVYALESNKLCTVADKRLAIDLDLSFRRNIRGGVESQQYPQLHALIRSFIFSNSKDRWVWDLNGSGDFLVKDVRSMIDDFMLPNDHVATHWIKCIPIKVNVFAWKVRHDRLATKNNLMIRGISVDSPLCPICSQSNEDVSHIFFCCDLAYLVSKRVCRCGKKSPVGRRREKTDVAPESTDRNRLW